MSVHLIFEFLTAFVGTIAFALLFQVPKEYYVNCGLAGGCGWICYKLLLAGCGLFGSTFFATILVVFLSRLSAVHRSSIAYMWFHLIGRNSFNFKSFLKDFLEMIQYFSTR